MRRYHVGVQLSASIRQASIPSWEAELLLAAILQKDRSFLLAHGEEEVPADAAKMFTAWVRRRQRGEPLAYITGEKEFYGRIFSVDPRVMIPRYSTEGLCAVAVNVLGRAGKCNYKLKTKNYKLIRELDTGISGYLEVFGDLGEVRMVVDIGTGSGCIAVTLACECPSLRIIATDISRDALNVATANAKKYRVSSRIEFREGSLLRPLEDVGQPFFLVSNPPYVPEGMHLPREVSAFEPREALVGGPDGTAVLRPLLQEARAYPFCRGFLLECREDQVGLFS